MLLIHFSGGLWVYLCWQNKNAKHHVTIIIGKRTEENAKRCTFIDTPYGKYYNSQGIILSEKLTDIASNLSAESENLLSMANNLDLMGL
ncbi:MAG: hypothetical protein ACR5KV_06010 [Wolbachia sp.]